MTLADSESYGYRYSALYRSRPYRFTTLPYANSVAR